MPTTEYLQGAPHPLILKTGALGPNAADDVTPALREEKTHMLAKFVTLTRTLLERRRVACELDDEFEFHVEMQSRSNAHAGMSFGAGAQSSAAGVWRHRADHGSRPRCAYAVAGLALARRAIRAPHAAPRPGFAAVALLSLNVGIGFNTALFTLVDVLLLFRIEADGERVLRASQEAIRRMTVGLRNRWRST